MKYKKIGLLFGVAMFVSLLLRIFQLLFTIDLTTGFLKPEYKSVSYYLLLMIFASCLVVTILSFSAHRCPETPPKVKWPLALASFFLACAISFDLYSFSFASIAKQWQLTMLGIAGALAALFFLVYSLKLFFTIKIPKLLYILPAVYMIFEIICTFTSISSLALITDNIILMAGFCVILLFFICFAKLYNKIDTEINFRKLMASGFSASILCFAQSIPHIIINLMTGNGYLHTSYTTNIVVLAIGIFILTFTCSHFSYNNVYKRRRHRRSDPIEQELYM